MAQWQGLTEVFSTLRGMTALTRKTVTARVVYGGPAAPYALFVHEDLQARHPVGNAKFLEGPARRLEAQMADRVRRSAWTRNGLEEGVVAAAQMLLDATQAEVPVATGALKASGRVEVSS